MMEKRFDPETYTTYLAQETWREFGCRAGNAEDLQSWQQAFRPRLREALGINNILERGKCDLNPQREEIAELAECIRELWTIESEPGFRIPFYLLRPPAQEEPLPLVLAPHGHGAGHLPYIGSWENEEQKKEALKGERDIGLQAVRNGYIAMVPVLRGYHRMSLSWGKSDPKDVNTDHAQQNLALLFGRTLIGERCHDLSRTLDYAATRPEIDSERVVVTGNSGGGTISLFSAANDLRIKIAVPSCYFCTFEASIGAMKHCPCNFIPGIMRLAEMYDIAGLIAPRPFLAIAGEKDSIFPIAGVKEAFDKTKQIYSVAQAEEKCQLYIGSEGHRYYKKPVWPFVREWL